MDENHRQAHWDGVYREKTSLETSWYEADPELSLAMISRAGLAPGDPIIDVGSGRSLLVDRLHDAGFSRLSVLDVSRLALDAVRQRLPGDARVNFIVSDITEFQPEQTYRLWHDRAVFHFLTNPRDRARYKQALEQGLLRGGQLVMGTFAADGPMRCSGLEVMRYDARSLALELGPGFELLEHQDQVHVTPWGSEQRFCFCRFLYLGAKATQ